MIDFSILAPRNLIASWPAFAPLLGAVVTSGGPALRAVSVALLLGGFSVGLVMTLDDENQRPDAAAAAAYIRSAGPGAVLEFPSPSPGPQSLLEATMAPDGAAAPTDIEIVPVDTPTLDDRLRVGAPGDPNILGLGLRRSTVDQAAPEAARLAEPRPLFVVWNDLLPRSLDEVFSNLPGVRLVESRQFAGFGGPFLFVHRLEREVGRGSP